MSAPAFHNACGWLTPYGLACGYVELAIHKDANPSRAFSTDRRVVMHAEHGAVHVRAFDSDGRRTAWNSFRRVTDARKAFAAHIRAQPGVYRVKP